MCDKTDAFIEKARKLHGDRYDYSLVRYINAKTKVSIVCPEHGEYTTTPNQHLRPAFCPECSGKKRYTTAEYVAKVSAIHGFRYSYDKTEYKTSKSKVVITCLTHGDFEQLAGGHLLGKGCRQCGIDEASERYKMPIEQFIEKAKSLHGDKYDYSNFKYSISGKASWITCPKHGDFKQSANSHLSGSGCPACYKEGRTEIHSHTAEQFMAKAIEVHGFRYDYSKTEYRTSRDRVAIVCKDHGVFYQTPSNHLRGCGCQLCPRNYDQPCVIYIMVGAGCVKIGISSVITDRYRKISSVCEFDVSLHSFITCPNTPLARSIESRIHKQLAHLNCGYTGFDGATEWFNIDPNEAFSLVREAVEDEDAMATLLQT